MSATLTSETIDTAPGEGVGHSARRPDGTAKVEGSFVFASDLAHEEMLWGYTLRSEVPRGRIESIDTTAAHQVDGVVAVLTAHDIPGAKNFGIIIPDQPVLAESTIRYQGEPLAIIAAISLEAARLASLRIKVRITELEPVCTVREATRPQAPLLHDSGNVVRELCIRRGDIDAIAAPVVVRGTYTVGMQDQVPLGTEAGLAIPTAGGGVQLLVNSQWIHADLNQLAAVLDLPPEQIELTLAGVGGAFGAREDLTLHAHLSLLAMATGRPVKMVYSREESFYGHVHRHPAELDYEHGADAEGRLLYVRCRIRLDGGAYASTSPAVVSNSAAFAVGPYVCDNVEITGAVVYTNNPPCGAMRGFGAVQSAVAHEAQMDRLAAEIGMDPVEFRLRNALDEGDMLPTGQVLQGPMPIRQILEQLRDLPPVGSVPATPEAEVFTPGSAALLDMPGGVGNVTHGEGLRRGVGYGLGFKAGGMPEGIRDYSTARVRLLAIDGEAVAQVHSAAAEVGQGVNSVQLQIVREELGIRNVVLLPADTGVGSAGSSSASRQTYMTGGAVLAACNALRTELIERAHQKFGHRAGSLLESSHEVKLSAGEMFEGSGARVAALTELIPAAGLEAERRFDHKPTTSFGENGQGEPHVQFIVAGHRAVADVDVESGLTRLVHLDVVQDVGRAINPLAVEGQMQGGTVQGIGLALMEEIQLDRGRVLNPSLTDYLIPTVLDVPTMNTVILEIPDPEAPYGIKGAGEPSSISSTPAIVSALRAASGAALTRVPVRPWDIVRIDLEG